MRNSIYKILVQLIDEKEYVFYGIIRLQPSIIQVGYDIFIFLKILQLIKICIFIGLMI